MAKRRTQKTPKPPALMPEQVEQSILILRGHKVLIDEQLAVFYGVETRALIQAVKRNTDRFPIDFMFRLSDEEWGALRSQFVISKPGGRGGRRYAPYAFTEQGVAMLSSVLRSKRAVRINIEIMRAFVRLRQLLSAHKELAKRIQTLEHKMVQRDAKTDHQIEQIMALLDQLFNPPHPTKKPIGFHTEHEPPSKPGRTPKGTGKR